MRAAVLLALFLVPAPGFAQSPGAAPEVESAAASAARSAVIYVARRGWHIDIGFAAADLQAPLRSLATAFPGVRHLFFGFGDARYLLAKHHNGPVLLAALWPGRGMILATALTASPQQAFGREHVIALNVTPQQHRALQTFVWQGLERSRDDESPGEESRGGNASGGRGGLEVADGTVQPAASGPYEGSAYFPAIAKYSAIHTCNTWAAEALKAAGLPVRSSGVVFAGQLWTQVRRLERGADQLQGGLLPSWHTTVVPEPGGTTTVVFFAGGGGLLLLMQPDSREIASSKLDKTFIVTSSRIQPTCVAGRLTCVTG